MSDVLVRCTHASMRGFCAVALAAALIFTITSANAAVTYNGRAPGDDPGETNSATATFALLVSGNTTDLVVTLTDTAAYKPNDSQDILTSVFFTLAGDPTLTKVSGLLGAGCCAVESGTNLTITSGIIGGSWAYAAGLRGAPDGANEGISATSCSLFGSWNLFPGSRLPGDCSPPDGVAGGLTSAVDDGSKYNCGLSGQPFIKDSAVFTLGNVSANFSLSQISNVGFGYGTIPDQFIKAMLVPEPSACALAGAGLLLMLLISYARKTCLHRH
ncbi:MAG TPA: XDD4 family exosortase-dependent surface protein [Verrucomicrobiae bacterium]|nr:XDD4 family exosortase-dependent surface protein [Verrucomicrobiae bacterium]